MSKASTLVNADWLTLVPAIGLERRSVGIPAGLWFGVGIVQGDATGGIVVLNFETTFAFKSRWVHEWMALSAFLPNGTTMGCQASLNTGPQVTPGAHGLTNPTFREVLGGVSFSGAQSWNFTLGSAGGRPLLTFGDKAIAGGFTQAVFTWETNITGELYQVGSWGYYYANQGLFRGVPPDKG